MKTNILHLLLSKILQKIKSLVIPHMSHNQKTLFYFMIISMKDFIIIRSIIYDSLHLPISLLRIFSIFLSLLLSHYIALSYAYYFALIINVVL